MTGWYREDLHEQTTIVAITVVQMQWTDSDRFVAQTSAFRPWQIMTAIPGNVITMLPEGAMLCSH